MEKELRSNPGDALKIRAHPVLSGDFLVGLQTGSSLMELVKEIKRN
jgi:hypothetical protein